MSQERPKLDPIRDALREHDQRGRARPVGDGVTGPLARPDDPIRESLREHDEHDEHAPAGRGGD